MAKYNGITGKTYTLQINPFASGGEGSIYDINEAPGCVAKIYHTAKRTKELERKLSVMLRLDPGDYFQYTWPIDILYENGKFAGYLMPKIKGKTKLRQIYAYDNRLNLPWSMFVSIAKNLSASVNNIHDINQVVGDLNPDNILVDPRTGLITLVDNDSFHISDTNRTYRCCVGMPEFVAPELHGIDFISAPLPTFSCESDRFSLAVIIFALLMNGAHPFSCKISNASSSSFQPIDNMVKGKCAFFSETCYSNMSIPPYAPELSFLPYDLQMLFKRAFVDGLKKPSLRPSAEEFYISLSRLERTLKNCSYNSKHLYYVGSSECPWCRINRKMGTLLQPTINRTYKSTPAFNPNNTYVMTQSSIPSRPAAPANNTYTATPVKTNGKKQSRTLKTIALIIGSIILHYAICYAIYVAIQLYSG